MKIIAGQYKGRILKTMTGPGYRPATGKIRESLFSMLESTAIRWTEAEALDVFAGSGSLGFEALSRGAKSVLFIEKNAKACLKIKQNISTLNITPLKAQVINADALLFLDKGMNRSFDLVFIDPPYGRDLARPALDILLRSNLLSRHGLVCIEIERQLSFQPQFHADLELIKDKNFGQTRILIWTKN
jgi:16S rRNA (guanine966-N2)-methyltransferase